jgi:hypothetical protein
MPRIAISYRHTDRDATGRIFDRLSQKYGKDSIFRDIDSIPFGIDFRKVVNNALRDTDVLIAVVGPNWRGSDKQGIARIHEENDLVRIEVETALQRDIPVIPVLVGGAFMPKPADLPETLRNFSFRNAANIDGGRNFDTDVERLMRSLDRIFESRTAKTEMAQTKVVATDTVDEPVETTAPVLDKYPSDGLSDRLRVNDQRPARFQADWAEFIANHARVELEKFIAKGQVSDVY